MKIDCKTIAYSKFKLIFRHSLLLMSLVILACTQNSNKPNSHFELLNGTLDRLENYRDGWLLVNFWADWCEPCKEEVSELNQLFLESQHINLKILSISYEPLSNQNLAKLVKSWNILYPVMATDPVPILPFSLPNQLPAHYLINPKGEIVQKIIGKQTQESLKITLEQAKKDDKSQSLF